MAGGVTSLPLLTRASQMLAQHTGSAATAGVLLGGLVAFKNGNSALAQHFMRARVVTQGITVRLGASLELRAAAAAAASAAAGLASCVFACFSSLACAAAACLSQPPSSLPLLRCTVRTAPACTGGRWYGAYLPPMPACLTLLLLMI